MTVECHLVPARWMTKAGYRHLAAGRYPGAGATPSPRIDPLAPMITGPKTDRPHPAVRWQQDGPARVNRGIHATSDSTVFGSQAVLGVATDVLERDVNGAF